MNFKDRIEKKFNLTQNIDTLQVNVGALCNLTCEHCHVQAGPARKEKMTRETAEKIEKVLKKFNFNTLDITGGEPSMNENFNYLIEIGNKYCDKVIVRTNLVYLSKRPEIIDFLKANRVHLVASLPCYTEENTDQQRGKGTFEDSIKALRLLNEAGFAREEGLVIDLVYNPGGPFLPGPQADLELDYKNELKNAYGIDFSKLICITNLPIGRFKEALIENNLLEEYTQILEDNFNPATVENIMCRSQISVGYDGGIYDCDFNQMLGLKAQKYGDIDKLLEIDELDREIVFEDHCYGCTAGAGSSCKGALL